MSSKSKRLMKHNFIHKKIYSIFRSIRNEWDESPKFGKNRCKILTKEILNLFTLKNWFLVKFTNTDLRYILRMSDVSTLRYYDLLDIVYDAKSYNAIYDLLTLKNVLTLKFGK